MFTLPSALLISLALALGPAQQSNTGCTCHATNARYNVVNQPKTGYDYIPIVADDSLGFYVAYSAKQNDDNTGFVSTSCMYVLPLLGDEVLIFGGGFGDTFNIPGGAFFDADYDVAFIKEAIAGCMGRDPTTTKVRFVAPHGHPDHITVAFIRALERAGLAVIEIAFQENDRGWIESLPWLPEHNALFHVLPSGRCNEEIFAYESPLGHIGVIHRPGHTPGSIDLVLDVLGNPASRVLVLGSTAGGCPPPDGVYLTLTAHGTAMVGGPRRAQSEVLNGSGVNRLCLSSSTPPKLGTTWTAALDTEGHPGAAYVLVFATDCVLNPGVMTPYGELLVNPLGRPQLNSIRPVTGVLGPGGEEMTFAIPNDASLMGRQCYAQGTILGGGAELCNALRLVIGF